MARNGGRLSRVMLMANPCMLIHLRTPTPMEASLLRELEALLVGEVKMG